jgi:hypothetical protein
VRGALRFGGFVLAVVALAGCGSSGGGGSVPSGWKVASKTTTATTNYESNATYTAKVASPTAIALHADGSPSVKLTGNISVLCDGSQNPTTTPYVMKTPFLVEAKLPAGTLSSCQVWGSAPIGENQSVTMQILSK